MTEAAPPELMRGTSPRRVLWRTALRVLVTTTTLVTSYFLLPLDRHMDVGPVALLILLLILIAVTLGFQVRAILRADAPALRAIEALAVSVPLLMLSFATTYFLMGRSDPGAFTQPLTRLDALYFAVTVFATVGFGDITAANEVTRAVVTVQMVVNLLVIGIGVRLITGAVRAGQQRRAGAGNRGDQAPDGRTSDGRAVDDPPGDDRLHRS